MEPGHIKTGAELITPVSRTASADKPLQSGKNSPWARLRIRQVRLVSRWACGLAKSSSGKALVLAARHVPGLVGLLIGYRRPHATLEAATEAVHRYENGGHVNPVNATNHLSLSERPRISDYPALLHIGRRVAGITRVFDLGGNVGNLYYCYTNNLAFPENLQWTVQDLPGHIARGRELAKERGARSLRFTDNVAEAESVDLFIASGCLHYFSRSLSETLAYLKTKPAYVLVNRTPMTDGASFATVQEASAFRVPCRLDNRARFIESVQAQGYRLVDRREAEEMSLEIPFYPDLTTPYTGFFFERV